MTRGVEHHYFISPGTSKGVISALSRALEKKAWKGNWEKYPDRSGERKQSLSKTN